MDAKEQIICSHCGHIMNATEIFGGPNRLPEPGDITVCIKCGTPHKFNGELSSIIPLSMKDLAALKRDQPDLFDQLEDLTRKIQSFNKQN